MFSATKGAGVRKLVTQTFMSNTSWTAPGFLTQLASAAGYGGAATADTPTSGQVSTVFANASVLSQPNSPYTKWEDLSALADNAVSIIGANTGTNLLSIPYSDTFVDSADRWSRINYTNPLWIIGNTSVKSMIGSHPTTGNILYSQLTGSGFFGWAVVASYVALGSSGPATTGFGQTFPGGTLTGSVPNRTAVAPSTTTFTNVAITPGTTYSIVVPSGGSLTISYYV